MAPPAAYGPLTVSLHPIVAAKCCIQSASGAYILDADGDIVNMTRATADALIAGTETWPSTWVLSGPQAAIEPDYAGTASILNNAATGTYTFTTNVEDDDDITIGEDDDEVVYTWKATLSSGPAVANEILVGANAAASKANLIAALNAAAGAGTTYGTGTIANPLVSAAAGLVGTSVTVTARTAGVAGNSIPTTENSTHAAWGAATLTGGGVA